MPFTFDDFLDTLAETLPVDPAERRAQQQLQERLRNATADEARQLARAIIRGRHDGDDTQR
jgi:hypothetical protein